MGKTFNIYGIDRLRIGIDGNGIRTLIVLQGCPLDCRYCINPFAKDVSKRRLVYSPKALYEKICRDRPYFRSTHGGVTFGGGEPLLQAKQIHEFAGYCRDDFDIC